MKIKNKDSSINILLSQSKFSLDYLEVICTVHEVVFLEYNYLLYK